MTDSTTMIHFDGKQMKAEFVEPLKPDEKFLLKFEKSSKFPADYFTVDNKDVKRNLKKNNQDLFKVLQKANYKDRLNNNLMKAKVKAAEMESIHNINDIKMKEEKMKRNQRLLEQLLNPHTRLVSKSYGKPRLDGNEKKFNSVVHTSHSSFASNVKMNIESSTNKSIINRNPLKKRNRMPSLPKNRSINKSDSRNYENEGKIESCSESVDKVSPKPSNMKINLQFAKLTQIQRRPLGKETYQKRSESPNMTTQAHTSSKLTEIPVSTHNQSSSVSHNVHRDIMNILSKCNQPSKSLPQKEEMFTECSQNNTKIGRSLLPIVQREKSSLYREPLTNHFQSSSLNPLSSYKNEETSKKEILVRKKKKKYRMVHKDNILNNENNFRSKDNPHPGGSEETPSYNIDIIDRMVRNRYMISNRYTLLSRIDIYTDDACSEVSIPPYTIDDNNRNKWYDMFDNVDVLYNILNNIYTN